MKLPVEWLRQSVQTPLPDEALADKLTMAGLEVEETTASEDGPVFHTKTTPNRGDWLSVLGVAREAAAALDVPLKHTLPSLPDENEDAKRWAGVRITHPDLCPRYCGKIIRNVTLGPSPDWMQKRLLGAGMRPINVVVDVTNYVMLELGQPLHAFDYDTIPDGQIVVRPATQGETFKTLDGMERTLTPEMLVICDQDRPLALAGIMGGTTSEVTPQTRHLFLESAHFDPGTIRRASKALGLTTEASYRFERFVDPELAPLAVERAAELLADLAGAEVILGRIDLYPKVIEARKIALRPPRVNALLGTDLATETIAHSLRRLGLAVDANQEPLQVTVPTFRPDLVQEIDLVEEVGRMVGYETLPETLPGGNVSGGDAPAGRFAGTLRTLFVGLGLQEALTHSLAAPSPFVDPQQDGARVTIRQALSAELSGLRPALVPNLLDILAHNLRRGLGDVALFEVGKVFSLGEALGTYLETRHVAAVLTGAASPRAWDNANPAPADFFTAKGMVEGLASSLHLSSVTFAPMQRAQMHPGRCASVSIAGQMLGYVAEVDPDAVRAHLDVPQTVGRVVVFELDADALLSLTSEARRYHALPRFPSVSRDINVVVDADTSYALLEETALAATDPALTDTIALQTIYTGNPIPAGKKAVALRLTFRAEGRTLTDADVDAQMAAVDALLSDRAQAERR
jgi:phenylalanyl-tRNA synthetase beta chain